MTITDVDITAKHVVINAAIFSPNYQDVTWRVFLCENGFGCSPRAGGSAVFGHTIRDGEKFRVERFDIERLATDDEITAALAAKEG